MSDNLPPGVTESMIPGNRPEDESWDNFYENVDRDCKEHGFSDIDATTVWILGISVYRQSLVLGVRYAHDPEEQKPQRQDSLDDQLHDLYRIANREGCYDAADLINKIRKHNGDHK